jgi:CubicO group peptidase (beta-lactamase class C family)
MSSQNSLPEAVDAVAGEDGFSGVVSVDRGGEVEFARAYGLAHRAHQIPNTEDTRFAIASGTKGLTALAVVSLIEQGVLDLSSTARSVLRDDLPLIDGRVTVEQLLAHRSGIGDYLDEDGGGLDVNDYLPPVPMQELANTEQYLAVLDGFPAKFPPGERFSYCNGSYVVAGADRRASQWRSVPRPGAGAGLRAGRDARHRVPALRRTPRTDLHWLRAGRGRPVAQ